MIEKRYETPKGSIVYWINEHLQNAGDAPVLILLPGLTADHRLFDKQLEYFESRLPLLVWDAPGHCASRPFSLDFCLDDKARWLKEIIELEGIARPLLVGQSMGGYVSQCFMELFPGRAAGFIGIDTAPLQRSYISGWEIWMLYRTEPMYRMYPWKALLRDGARGCAESPYGRQLMKDMMNDYDKDYYCKLVGHGYRMLAAAYESERAFKIDCPAMLICGDKDKAGSAKRYNKRWAAQTGLPFHLIPAAGHNSNTDKPQEVNALIEDFASKL